MNLVNTLKNKALELQNIKSYELVFVILLLLYLVSNVSTPYDFAPQINNAYMYISLFAIFILLLLNSNPFIAIFFAIVAVIFLQRSKKVDHKVMAPSTINKTSAMNNMNSHLSIKSLEEEMVGQIDRQPDNIVNPTTYHPVMCDSHDASFIN
jgi:predicted membrane protein